jgi:hypothetical protein
MSNSNPNSNPNSNTPKNNALKFKNINLKNKLYFGKPKSIILSEIKNWIINDGQQYDFFTYDDITDNYFSITLRTNNNYQTVYVYYPIDYPKTKNRFEIQCQISWVDSVNDIIQNKTFNISELLELICEYHLDYLQFYDDDSDYDIDTDTDIDTDSDSVKESLISDKDSYSKSIFFVSIHKVQNNPTKITEMNDIWELKSLDGNPSDDDSDTENVYLSTESDNDSDNESDSSNIPEKNLDEENSDEENSDSDSSNESNIPIENSSEEESNLIENTSSDSDI